MQVWDKPVEFTVLAGLIHEKLNPECCYRCGLIDFLQNFGVLTGLSVVELKKAQLCNFLKTKITDPENQDRHKENGFPGEGEK